VPRGRRRDGGGRLGQDDDVRAVLEHEVRQHLRADGVEGVERQHDDLVGGSGGGRLLRLGARDEHRGLDGGTEGEGQGQREQPAARPGDGQQQHGSDGGADPEDRPERHQLRHGVHPRRHGHREGDEHAAGDCGETPGEGACRRAHASNWWSASGNVPLRTSSA
jgi:hypothetical protein